VPAGLPAVEATVAVRVTLEPEVALAGALNVVVVGAPVTYTATVAPVAPGAGTPTGTVSFSDSSGSISGCSERPLSLESPDVATCSTQLPHAGADEITAALMSDHADRPQGAEHPMSADRVRWEHIQRIYEMCNRNVSETARRLNMHRRTLQRILAKRAPR